MFVFQIKKDKGEEYKKVINEFLIDRNSSETKIQYEEILKAYNDIKEYL